MPIATHAVTRATIGLGTFISVQTTAASLDTAHAGASAAFAAVARVERLMHPSRAGSDLCAVRAADPGVATAVDQWTLQVLLLSRQIHQASEGRFDPCLPQAPGRFGDLEFGDADGKHAAPWVIAHAPVHLDLGGIAKGFAVDRAAEALRHDGCLAGVVNCGGDLAVFGDAPQRIVCAGGDAGNFYVDLENRALASSDTHNPDRPPEHRGYYDGRYGTALRAGCAVIVAPTAAVADAMTKCALALGPEVDALLRHFAAELVCLEVS